MAEAAAQLRAAGARPYVIPEGRSNGIGALGYGGWSFTGAYNLGTDEDGAGATLDTTMYLVQLGYHFPGTAWEIAARASAYDADRGVGFALGGFLGNGAVSEYAFGVNYYLNGHGNKLSLDVSFLEAGDQARGIYAPYPGYQAGLANENSEILLRFQWQLAL